MEKKDIKKVVREGYARIAKEDSSCCGPVKSCCGKKDPAEEISKKIGYSEKELGSVPEGANLGLGCGNPVALASLAEGETVLDLGSGGGFDCFLAAKNVGESGKVIGVDMTPEMVERARQNATKSGYENVEFRLGEIENLPVADGSVDAVISNCVINLSPEKERVFAEAFRVLKPGGRVMISDVVLLRELPKVVQDSVTAYIGCLSGAILKEEYIGAMAEAGFQEIDVIEETTFPLDCMVNDPTAEAVIKDLDLPREALEEIAESVQSIKVHALKPRDTA